MKKYTVANKHKIISMTDDNNRTLLNPTTKAQPICYVQVDTPLKARLKTRQNLGIFNSFERGCSYFSHINRLKEKTKEDRTETCSSTYGTILPINISARVSIQNEPHLSAILAEEMVSIFPQSLGFDRLGLNETMLKVWHLGHINAWAFKTRCTNPKQAAIKINTVYGQILNQAFGFTIDATVTNLNYLSILHCISQPNDLAKATALALMVENGLAEEAELVTSHLGHLNINDNDDEHIDRPGSIQAFRNNTVGNRGKLLDLIRNLEHIFQHDHTPDKHKSIKKYCEWIVNLAKKQHQKTHHMNQTQYTFSNEVRQGVVDYCLSLNSRTSRLLGPGLSIFLTLKTPDYTGNQAVQILHVIRRLADSGCHQEALNMARAEKNMLFDPSSPGPIRTSITFSGGVIAAFMSHQAYREVFAFCKTGCDGGNISIATGSLLEIGQTENGINTLYQTPFSGNENAVSTVIVDLIQHQKHDIARQYCENMVLPETGESAPSSNVYRTNIAVAFIQADKCDIGIAIANQLISSPNTDEYRAMVAIELIRKNQCEDAKPFYTQGSITDTDDLASVACALIQKSKLKEAESVLKHMPREDFKRYQVLDKLNRAKRKQKRREQPANVAASLPPQPLVPHPSRSQAIETAGEERPRQAQEQPSTDTATQAPSPTSCGECCLVM